ncbi:MAG: PA2778 family cysteine peptidase [Marivibrio sp.]|uniref:PA2778 family cysteine peptidase n=1 Tax=Marivibrio sp. TaxID=2039719 RepID=UPI0032EE10F4
MSIGSIVKTGAAALRAAALVFLCAGLAACAGTPVADRLTAAETRPDDLPVRAELAATPFFAQTAFYCGPAALAAVLNETGLETTPEALGARVFTPGRKGSLQADVVTAARRAGRLVLPVASMTEGLEAVAAGDPVLILQNLGLEAAPQWHYAILIGYDLDAETAILRSGTTRRLVEDLATLEHTWRRSGFWGRVAAAPDGPVPTTARAHDWLAEAAGIERAGLGAEALAAYRTGADHWPQDGRFPLALGGALFAQGDLAGAEKALREAVARSPSSDAALNNLAYVRFRQGALEDAEELARRAIDLDGPNREAARETLAEIRAARAS